MRRRRPCVPKSSLVSTRPRPKSCSQSRFTATRATSGLLSSTSQRARPRRFDGLIVAHRVQRRRACRRTRARLGREAAAHAQLVRRPLERRPLLHHERRRNPQVGERLSRGGERVARRLQRAAASLGRTRRDRRPAPSLRSLGRDIEHGPQPRRKLGASERIGGRRRPTDGTGRCPGRSCRRADRSAA